MGASDTNSKWYFLRDPGCNCLFCIGGCMNIHNFYEPQTLMPLYELDNGWIQYEVAVDTTGAPDRKFFQPMMPGCIKRRGLATGVPHTKSGKLITLPGITLEFDINHRFAYESDWGLGDRLNMAINYQQDIAKHPFKGCESPNVGAPGRPLPKLLPSVCTLQGAMNAAKSAWAKAGQRPNKDPYDPVGELLVSPKTGFTCTQCGEINPYAVANQPNGTYVCSYHGVKLFA